MIDRLRRPTECHLQPVHQIASNVKRSTIPHTWTLCPVPFQLVITKRTRRVRNIEVVLWWVKSPTLVSRHSILYKRLILDLIKRAPKLISYYVWAHH